MTRHSIDLSRTYSATEFGELPKTRPIEIPDLDPLPESDPPTEDIEREPYLATESLIEVVNLAIALGRPLLLQGDPGCGKTRLAHAVAYNLGFPLEECYIKSTSRAQDLLYTYDAVNRLYDAQLGVEGRNGEDRKLSRPEARNYIHLGALGRAIARAQYGRPSVVLIDEIDKADIDFPNDLLWELDRLEFRVNEVKGMEYAVHDPKLRPIIIITHNEEKALPNAFLRRCIFHYLEFPQNRDYLRQILALHQIDNVELSQRAIDILLRLRKMENLSKKPGLSELLDWVGYLKARETPLEDLDKIPYTGSLLKQLSDQQRAREEFERNAGNTRTTPRTI